MVVVLLCPLAITSGEQSKGHALIAAVRSASTDDVSVVKTVLISNGLPEVVKNWGVEDPQAQIVLSDTMTGCSLPPGQTETRRVKKISNGWHAETKCCRKS
jgi:hypothetical protein